MTSTATSTATTAPPPPGSLGPVDQARWIANATATELAKHAPGAAAALIAQARAIDAYWYGPQLVINDTSDVVTTPEASKLLRIAEGSIRRWASTPHPDDPDAPLLPRWGTEGRYTTYRVVDLWEAKRVYKRMCAERQANRTRRRWKTTNVTYRDGTAR
jgi:hypothetical protein